MTAVLLVLGLLQAGGSQPGLGPRVMRLIDRAPAPPPGEVAVTLMLTADTVVAGEQVDVVTAAWFPRELLARLRRPPSLHPPTVDGVYSAVQPTGARVGTSRQVHGTWYDLYVAHQIVFPVTEGTVRIPGAGLTFSVPLGPQYFSEERPYNLTSTSRTLVVLPVPHGGPGPVARDLALTYELAPEPARAGEPVPVDVVLTGAGNLALWPAPDIAWPQGSRGYVVGRLEQPRPRDGLIGGTIRFRFTVLADSSGTLVLPDVQYPWFDPGRRAWSEAVARAVVLPVLPRATLPTARPPLPMLATEPWSLTAWHGGAMLAAASLVVLPPLLILGAHLAGRRRPARSRPRETAGAELERVVRALVPDAEDRRDTRLAARLREAGFDPDLAAEAAAVFHLLATARFDPSDVERPAETEARARRVVTALPARLRQARPWLAVLLLLLLLLLGPPSPALGGQVAGDSLYRAGAWAAAAEEYFRAAAGQRTSARHWYHAGAAAWAAGQDARAAAAWLEARRLAPRNPAIAAAWQESARRSADVQRAGRMLPLTPVELFLLSAALWAMGWLLVRRVRRVALVLLALGVAGGAAAGGLSWHQRDPLAVVARTTGLRDAPHGRAEETARVEDLTVVKVRASRPGWRLVETGRGVRGWLPDAILVEVRGLDFRS